MTEPRSLYIIRTENGYFAQPDFGIIWRLEVTKNKFENFTQRKTTIFRYFQELFEKSLKKFVNQL